MMAQPIPPLSFLADGTLVGLNVNGVELLRPSGQRSGFFALQFDGSALRELPFTAVEYLDGGRLRVSARSGLPRLEFAVTVQDGRLRLVLERVEGMPAEGDVSLGFRAGLSADCEVTPLGDVVLRQPDSATVTSYWRQWKRRTGGAGFGGWVLDGRGRA